MAESDGDWGALAEHDSELAEIWDGLERLPEAGTNAALDAFCAAKHISIGALLRLGAKLSEHTVLCFAYGSGLKFRDMVTDKRWNWTGSEFPYMKIVKRTTFSDRNPVIVAESETDAARLSDGYPEADIAVMGAGARYVPDTYVAQLAGYDQVLLALDDDESGNAGAAKFSEHIMHAQRLLAPEGGDWCEAHELPALPDKPEAPPSLIVFAGDLTDIDVPEQASWFEDELLPIGGLMLIHGPAKSFKSFLALDMLSSLAQGRPWCHFEPTEEPTKVCVVQFEIPLPYYLQRTNLLRAAATEPQLFDENFGTFTPRTRPRLVAGDPKTEDPILAALVDAEVQVVMIDPIRRGMGFASMNDENEVRKMLAFFERMNDEGITVVATHHNRKANSRGGEMDAMTGSGAFAGDADSVLSINVPPKLDASTTYRNISFVLRNAPAPSGRSFQMTEEGSLKYSLETIHPDDGDEANVLPDF